MDIGPAEDTMDKLTKDNKVYNKHVDTMYNEPWLPDAAVIDNGLAKDTRSRGAMDNKSAHNNNQYRWPLKYKFWITINKN